MKSHPLPARRRRPRASDGALRIAKHQPAAISSLAYERPCPRLRFQTILRAAIDDPECRTDDTPEGTSMKAAIRSSALAQIFLVAGVCVGGAITNVCGRGEPAPAPRYPPGA